MTSPFFLATRNAFQVKHLRVPKNFNRINRIFRENFADTSGSDYAKIFLRQMETLSEPTSVDNLPLLSFIGSDLFTDDKVLLEFQKAPRSESRGSVTNTQNTASLHEVFQVQVYDYTDRVLAEFATDLLQRLQKRHDEPKKFVDAEALAGLLTLYFSSEITISQLRKLCFRDQVKKRHHRL